MDFKSFHSSNLFDVKGKSCIVTGGGTGLGKAFATALALNGAKVIINGRRENVLKSTAEEINTAAKEAQMGGEVIPVQGDVATKQGIVEFYEKCTKHFDKLDFLVNNAGFSSNWKVQTKMVSQLIKADHCGADDQDDVENLEEKLWSIDDVDFANMTAIHVAGPYLVSLSSSLKFRLMKQLAVKCIPLFKKSNDPSIVNITSLGAYFLNRSCCEFSYAQSKAAEEHMTRMMSAGLMPFKIRVNAICPGLFHSNLTTDDKGNLWPPMEEATKSIPKGRPGLWSEIGGTCLMLASPAGGYFNGATLLVDGGWLLTASANDV